MKRKETIEVISLARNCTLLLLVFTIFSCTTETKNPEPAVKKEIPTEEVYPVRKNNKNYLKEKDLISYISTAGMVKPKRTAGRPFDSLDYDKVIAHDFDGCEEPYPSVINKKGRFVPVILKQQFLTQNQADKIFHTLTRISTYGGVTASCFNPHFALLLFKENRIIYKTDICLDCHYLVADTEIPAENHFKAKIGDHFEYFLAGFSKLGRKRIVDLCKQLNFYYGETEYK